MWIVAVCAFFVGIILGAFLIFMRFYHDKDCGKKFFEDSEKPFNKKAPEMYYHKQRMFRMGQGCAFIIYYYQTNFRRMMRNMSCTVC